MGGPAPETPEEALARLAGQDLAQDAPPRRGGGTVRRFAARRRSRPMILVPPCVLVTLGYVVLWFVFFVCFERPAFRVLEYQGFWTARVVGDVSLVGLIWATHVMLALYVAVSFLLTFRKGRLGLWTRSIAHLAALLLIGATQVYVSGSARRAEEIHQTPRAGYALHCCLWEGDVDRARGMLSIGVSADVPNPVTKVRPLHIAVDLCERELVRLLLDKGADPTAATARGVTAMHLAAMPPADTDRRRIRPRLGTDLLPRGSSVDWHEECPPGYADSPDGRYPADSVVIVADFVLSPDPYGGSAADADPMPEGQLGVLRRLCSLGANVNAPDENGITPLHIAAGHGARKTARLLLDAGADVNAMTKDGRTPVALALADAMYVTAKMLQQAGGKPTKTPGLASWGKTTVGTGTRPATRKATQSNRHTRPVRE